jgi:hypothetical protein
MDVRWRLVGNARGLVSRGHAGGRRRRLHHGGRREFRLLEMLAGSTVTGRFAHIGPGFSLDDAHAGYVGAIYGLRVWNIVGGRGSFDVALGCPSGSIGCSPLTVGATALERLRTTVGKAGHRRVRVLTRRVVVATATRRIVAGRGMTFLVLLNRVGRRLLAHAPGTLAVQVTASAHGRTLARKRVRVRRL